MSVVLPRIAPPQDAPVDFLAVIDDDLTRECVRQAAQDLGWPQNHIREGGLMAACEQLRRGRRPDLLLVDVSAVPDVVAAMDALADVCEAHTRVIAIGGVNDVGVYRALMSLGVSDYLVKPVAKEAVAEALREAARREPRADGAASGCRTVALVGARGGVGTTSLAVSIAWALAEERARRTVLLDLDLQFGTAALSLDLEPGRGLQELLSYPERIDALLIGSASVQAGERLKVMAAEAALEAEIRPQGDGVEVLLQALAGAADAVVIDAARGLDRWSRQALARADAAVIVTDLSLAGMRDSRRLLDLLGPERAAAPLLVGNRVGAAPGELPRAEFEKGVGRALDFAVPSDAKAAAAAVERGRPLAAAARQGLGEELRRLAATLAGEGGAPAPKAPLLKRLLGR